MDTPQTKAELARFLGLSVEDVRLDELFLNFEEILAAIEALRRIDLGETLPAVIFSPVENRS